MAKMKITIQKFTKVLTLFIIKFLTHITEYVYNKFISQEFPWCLKYMNNNSKTFQIFSHNFIEKRVNYGSSWKSSQYIVVFSFTSLQ